MKHTEGKWFIEKGWNKAEMHIVANDKTIVICRTIEADIPIEEGESNAKLISKAPEMYEALYSIREWHIAVHEHGKHKHFPLSTLINLLKEIES
jgi:hypothetical protein